MAVQLETNIKRFRGLSTDIKPGHVSFGEDIEMPNGSVFTEIDTGARFVWPGSWPWVRQEQTIEPLLIEMISVMSQILRTLEAMHRGHEEHLWEENVEVETE